MRTKGFEPQGPTEPEDLNACLCIVRLRRAYESNRIYTVQSKNMNLSLSYRLYQWKVDVDILNSVQNVLADVLSSSNCSGKQLMLEMSANTFYTAFSISTPTFRW